MEVAPIQVEQYISADGGKPFQERLNALSDAKAKLAVYKRLARLETGNLGDFKFFESILELRIDYGPG